MQTPLCGKSNTIMKGRSEISGCFLIVQEVLLHPKAIFSLLTARPQNKK